MRRGDKRGARGPSQDGGLRIVAFWLLLVAIAGTSAGASIVANAHSYKLDEITVGHVWAPPPEEGADGLPVYGPILNRGGTTARLISASTAVAEQVRFRTEEDGEVRWPAAIELKPGRPLALAAWREHIWVSGLKTPLTEGDSFELILDFGEAGRLTVKVVVEKASGH